MVPDHWSNDAMVSMDRCGLMSDVGKCGLGGNEGHGGQLDVVDL